jgi:pyruvate/2-oxoacid:ferredoxin oxidoreductase alpha subunit
MANVNRSMGPPWNIWSDQTDSLAQRDTGWLQFYCENNQEILDTIIQAYKVCEKVLLPGMVILDAFILSHTSESVDIPPQDLVDKYLPPFSPRYKLDVDEPHTFGGLTGPDWYYELRYKIQSAMEDALPEIKKADDEFKRMFGRGYGLIDRYRMGDAETALVVSGSMSSTAREAIDMMRDKGEKIGLIKMRVFRPFPKAELRSALKGVKRVGVVDRNISFGSEGIFFQEVKSALCNEKRRVPVFGFVAGLGGRDVVINDFVSMAEKLKKDKEIPEIIWIGLKK